MDFTEFEAAVKEVTETGALSFAARRALWLALGPWEERDEMDDSPRTLTEPLRKRAELALACAKKVMKVWSAYDSEDKGPQELLKKANACLKGKLEADQLYQAWKASNYMHRTEEERYSSAPMAAIAAERAATVALWDEFLLEPRYAGADDSELDPYDWDAAWCAALAWSGRDEGASGGQRRVEEMKFWAWYLEQAAGLLGIEGFKFPKKAIKDFEEKQNPPKPVPKEVTLESLADFLNTGELRYCCRNLAKQTIYDAKEPLMYYITTRQQDKSGVCPKCKAVTTQLSHWMSGNVLEWDLPGGVHFMVVEETPVFRCPNHPKEWANAPFEPVNWKALFKRYITGTGRAEALKRQIEERAVYCFSVSEHGAALNKRSLDWFLYHILARNAIPGLRWVSQEDDSFAVDLSAFGPHVYFLDLTYEEFVKRYPERVRQTGEQTTEIDFAGVWARCYLDKRGALVRLETTSRFRVQLKDPKRDERHLAMGLHKALGMSGAEARTRAESQGRFKYAREREEMDCLSGLSRAEAERILTVLRGCGVQCRIMPWLIAKKGDTW